MRNLLALIRILIIVGLAALSLEYIYGTEEASAIVSIPAIDIFLGFLTLILIAIEMVNYRVEDIIDHLLTDEQKRQRELQQQNSWLGRLYQKMLDQKPLEKESEIILDHNYDGIQELDNNLPPWWTYLFYACIIFAIVYLLRYEVFGGDSQITEYNKEMNEAKVTIEAFKKANPNLIDADNVTQLTDDADIQEGKNIFQANCMMCHAPDGGGGIGPNLTDDHWILGGGIKNVFHTISEGGREGKGMVAWKATLSAKERQQVASYVLSLQGTTPASPKAPEGDVWKE
ncbi:cbb3-type cytochrome c oxidase N-terminal domain-containing protein [Capnocytophaga sp. oral taxon 338]|jgi:cytochrome c oxidase, cbb3-type, subunit III|uniref:cbb3-type cytochrome c oxidase N-terminal domain-containing protein n=1 Tax=Capnocytophaga sp. oral taxon 338 TaxID=710239 RepID=UPI000202E05C|nr:cbb3-type cytochrome c oxidase N-terminal domain-containing protein [Capnocytophaga sp. oral taxon 338]EGD34134.1 cb-type cytochrome c oxidase subunit III [Capnocytophaga sp. oral taxon 338 str. F0234]